MPIYEYMPELDPKSCPHCRYGFEIYQKMSDKPLSDCPQCGQRIKKIISWCRAAIVENSEEQMQVESQLKDYETAGMWSHAAELADKHSEKTKDKGLKTRALDDYKKAGYDTDSLSKHAKLDKNE